VSNADDENLDSEGFDLEGDDFDLSGDDMLASDDDSAAAGDDLAPADEPVSEETAAEEGLGDLDALEPVVSDDASEEEEEDEAVAPVAKKKSFEEGPGLVGYAVWAICGLSCVCLAVANVMIFLDHGSSSLIFLVFLNLLWLLGTLIPFLLWMGRKANDTYVVMLGLSLAGVLLAVGFLLMELVPYGGDIKAKGAPQVSRIAPAAQSSAESIRATA
jgi:hypothetical protein